MSSVDKLAVMLECHVMPGRLGDAMELAFAIEDLIDAKIYAAMRVPADGPLVVTPEGDQGPTERLSSSANEGQGK